MTEKIFIFILLIHFLADFGLQTYEQATNKYKMGEQLFYHASIYSLIWLIGANLFLNFENSCYFALITLFAHFFTDAITSNITKPYFEKQDYHNGFVVVGFDQMLHYLQLYFIYVLNCLLIIL